MPKNTQHIATTTTSMQTPNPVIARQSFPTPGGQPIRLPASFATPQTQVVAGVAAAASSMHRAARYKKAIDAMANDFAAIEDLGIGNFPLAVCKMLGRGYPMDVIEAVLMHFLGTSIPSAGIRAIIQEGLEMWENIQQQANTVPVTDLQSPR